MRFGLEWGSDWSVRFAGDGWVDLWTGLWDRRTRDDPDRDRGRNRSSRLRAILGFPSTLIAAFSHRLTDCKSKTGADWIETEVPFWELGPKP
jgi:hypothetical protein